MRDLGPSSESSTVAETLGPLVISLSPGWTYQHQVTIQLPRPMTGPHSEFQPNIVVIKSRLATATAVEVLADTRRPLLARHLPSFEFDLATRHELLGLPAVRLMYTWHNGTHRLRQMLVLWVSGDSLYEFTYSDVAIRFGDTVAEFDRWLAGLGLAGLPPVSAAVVADSTRP